ncbi:hypothetical protein V5F53_16425 [Xanthobacter sp. V4C-4]|uniref:hypothetical protein n=1 Tax=Xanthobacter cornucopiae TaxID=3119924 RepID=UPI003727CD0F
MTMRDQEQRPSSSNPNQKPQTPAAPRDAGRQQQQAQVPGQKGAQPQQGGHANPQKKDDPSHGQR